MANDLLDKERNPGQSNWDTKLDQKKSAESSSTSNIDAASQAESNPLQSTGGGDKNDAPNSEKKGLGPQLLNKKVTPFYALVGLFLLSFGALLVMQAPGIVGVMAVNSVMNNLYDSLNSAEIRAGHKFNAKLSQKPLKGCKTLKTIRCSYKTHSKKQLNRLKTAGFEVKPKNQKAGLNGRTKINALVYTDANGKKMDVTPKEFRKMYRKDPRFRSMVNSAYNPRWAMLRDKAATNVLNKLKISFERKLGGSKSQMKRDADATIKNGDSSGRVNRANADPADAEADPSKRNPALEAEAAENRSKLGSKSNGFKSMVGTGLRSANIVSGVQASGCMLIGTANALSTMARIHSFNQSIQLYTLIANIAHSQVYGEATPEAVSFMGDLLTSRDMNEKAFSEASLTDDNKSLVDTLMDKSDEDIVNSSKLTANPHYGKSPMDSAGMIAATTGTPPPLDMRESQYVMGGGLAGSMKGFVTAIRDKIPGLSQKACAIWENPVVQIGGLALSAAAIIGSGGSVAVGQGVRAAVTIGVVYLGMKYLTARMSDMLSGAQYNTDLESVDFGNALYSGGAAFYSTMASSRGLTPISTEAGNKPLH